MGIGSQPEKVLIDSDLITGGTRFLKIATSILIIRPDFSLPYSTCDYHAIARRYEIEGLCGSSQQFRVRFYAV